MKSVNIWAASTTVRGKRYSGIQDIANSLPIGLGRVETALPGKFGIWAKVPPTTPVFRVPKWK